MRIVFFSSKRYDREYFGRANASHGFVLEFHDAHLDTASAPLASGAGAVCAFVNDDLSRGTLTALKNNGVDFLLLRSTGYNHVDLDAARDIGIAVARVPAYSPHAVAEHTLALMLSLNRKIHRAWNRVREGNFALDGLIGFDMQGKTAGLVGTGNIGSIVANILLAMDCRVIASDPERNPELQDKGVRYVEINELFSAADIISLHCPLTPETRHLVDDHAFEVMKPGAMLVNTSRGVVIDTHAAIRALKSGKLGYLGLDVYEEEGDLFFENLSDKIIEDDIFMRLTTFPNVLITGHQGFFTRDALTNIANTTLDNLACLVRDGKCANRLA